MRALYIFTHDLRVHDNTLLQELSRQAKELICVYVLDQRFLTVNYFQQSSLGRHRQRFLQQTLQDLQQQLQMQQQRLIIKVGDSKKIIPPVG